MCLGCDVLVGGCLGFGATNLNECIQHYYQDGIMYIDEELAKSIYKKLSDNKDVVQDYLEAIMCEPVDEMKRDIK